MYNSSQSSQSVLTKEELTDLINDTVLYILSNENSLHLIKRQDISKNVLKDRKRHFIEVIKGVKTRLLKDFNFELIDIEENKQYALVNRLEQNLNTFPEEIESERSLILLVLTLIFMNNGVMTEDELSKCLKRLNLKGAKADIKHEYFGDVENAIKKKFIRWSFLESHVIMGTDPPFYEYRWGKRAEEQVSKRLILEYACQIIGDTEPKDWGKQLTAVDEQEAKKMNATC